MGIHIGRISAYFGVVGRGDNGIDEQWLGFYYGSWLPRAKIDRQGPAWCLDSSWLCFHSSIYWNDRIDDRRHAQRHGGKNG